MRKYLILLCVLALICGTVVYARMNVGILGGSVPVAAGGIACSGSQIFGWSMESVDLTADLTGCTDDETTTVTLSQGVISSAQYQDGSNSFYTQWNNYYATIPITFGGDGESGTIDVYIYLPASGTENWSNYVITSYGATYVEDTDSYIAIRIDDSEQFMVTYGWSGNHVNLSNSVDQSALSGWKRIIVKWDRGEATTLSINFDGTTTTSTDTLGALAGAPNTLKVLTDGGDGPAFYFDLLKIYNTWQ